jgi:hypothetical protein
MASVEERNEMDELGEAICVLFEERSTSKLMGAAVLVQLLIAVFMEEGFERDRAIRLFTKSWDTVGKRFDA